MNHASHVLCNRGALRILALLAALALAPTLRAQAAGEKQLSPTSATPAQAWIHTNQGGQTSYSMKFDGGTMRRLKQVWKETFTNDNFVMTESAGNVQLPPFELLNSNVKELARSIAFLSQGALVVEVVPAEYAITATVWRIGTPSIADGPSVKMRAVAAPYLFRSGETKVAHLLEAAEKIENDRRNYLEMSSDVPQTRLPRNLRTRITPLPDQKVVVLIGTEEGIAGIESFIQASEHALAELVTTGRGSPVR
jgi:hypothetical protein